MNKFITGKELEDAIYDIIWDAQNTLLIVSPYIKLDDYFKKLFDNHKNNPKLHIIIVFGKNESFVSKSLSKEDFDFFKKFPFVSIVYVPNLHAKYYGNEQKGIVTSINLYDYSFKNNIEFGIYSEQSVLNTFTDTFTGNPDKEAWNKCYDIAEQNDVIFIKRPMYEKAFLGLSKNYVRSEELLDYTEHFYGRKTGNYVKRRLLEFKDELGLGSSYSQRPDRDAEEANPVAKSFVKKSVSTEDFKKNYSNQNFVQTGYCIRTGEAIPFNPSRPFTYSAWQSWAKWENYDFQEKFCHKTGKLSNGKTSMRNPILYDF